MLMRTDLLQKQSLFFKTLGQMAFEYIVGNGENAGTQYYFLFPQCFCQIRGLKLIGEVIRPLQQW